MVDALLVYATGRTELARVGGGDVLVFGDTCFRWVGLARDRNTRADGIQLEGADGPPNDGRLVYLETWPGPRLSELRGAVETLSRTE